MACLVWLQLLTKLEGVLVVFVCVYIVCMNIICSVVKRVLVVESVHVFSGLRNAAYVGMHWKAV